MVLYRIYTPSRVKDQALDVTSLSHWNLSEDLADYIITTFFEQPRLDSSALVRGRLPNGSILTWLYSGRKYYPISQTDHEKFRRAAKSRGGGYSMEVCEFFIEDVLANGDIVLNYFRRVADDTGEGGRMILAHVDGKWTQKQQLGAWEKYD